MNVRDDYPSSTGYSNSTAVDPFVYASVCTCIATTIRGIFMKLRKLSDQEKRMKPIYFQVRRNLKVTMNKSVNDQVNRIETKPFIVFDQTWHNKLPKIKNDAYLFFKIKCQGYYGQILLWVCSRKQLLRVYWLRLPDVLHLMRAWTLLDFMVKGHYQSPMCGCITIVYFLITFCVTCKA